MDIIARKVLNLFIALLLFSFFIISCAGNKDNTIRCSKCGLSPAELQKKYDEKEKGR